MDEAAFQQMLDSYPEGEKPSPEEIVKLRAFDAVLDYRLVLKNTKATRLDPTVDRREHGGNYDPLTPNEWSRAVGKMLEYYYVRDTPKNREMLKDFNRIGELYGQLLSVCFFNGPQCNPFYIHGLSQRFEVRQDEDGYIEAIASRQYDGTF